MVERDVLPRDPRGRRRAGPGRAPVVVAAAVVAVLALVALAWVLTRDDGSGPTASSSETGTTPTAPASTAEPGETATGRRATGSASPRASTRTSVRVPAIAPAAEFTNTCRYVVGDRTSGTRTGYRLVAKSTIENTGNVGIEVDVQAWWAQGDSERMTETKRVRVGWRQTETVNISLPVSEKEIELIRQHQGPDANCKVDPTIVATFGDPR